MGLAANRDVGILQVLWPQEKRGPGEYIFQFFPCLACCATVVFLDLRKSVV